MIWEIKIHCSSRCGDIKGKYKYMDCDSQQSGQYTERQNVSPSKHLSLCNATRLDKLMTRTLKVNLSVRCCQLLVTSKSGTEQLLNIKL